MSLFESRLEPVRRLLLDAALDPEAWPAALTAFAEVCGGFSGQLIARDGQDRLLFHLLTNVEPGLTEIGEASGLGDMARNPRLRIGRHAAVMSPRADQSVVDAEGRRRYDIYADYFERYDLAFNCQVVLHRTDDLLIRTSITRTAAQGPLEPGDFDAFEVLAPYVQAAARQQLAAELRAVEGVLQAAELAGDAIWVLNRFGRLIAASAAAERLLARGTPFGSVRGRLRFQPGEAARQLETAISRGLAAWSDGMFPAPEHVIVAGPEGPLTINVTTLRPRPFSLAGEPAVLISGSSPGERRPMGSLRSDRGLSPAEAHIAELLASGLSPAEVAEARGVSVETVRTQIRAIFRKVGVRRLSELVARLIG